MNICHCDWLNKEDDWSIVKQDKVRRESQTEDAGKEKGGVWSPKQIQREAKWSCCTEKGYRATW